MHLRRRPVQVADQPPPTPRAQIRAYLGDCVINADIELGADTRLTDLLNTTPTVTLYDVHLYALDDGREVVTDAVELDLAELHAIEAPEKPLTSSRHIHTRTILVEVHAGPYLVTGHIHGPPGGDPVQTVIQRPAMVPLTEALVEFEFAGQPVTVESSVVIFNRDVASSLRAVDDPMLLAKAEAHRLP